MRILCLLALLALVVVACGTPGSGISPTDWECQAYDMHGQYFRAFGTTREQTFESVMAQCKLESMDGSTCIGDPQKCMPPKAQ